MFSFFSKRLKNTSTLAIEEVIHQNPLLVDVRTPDEFAAGSVPGAINIPLQDIQNRIDEFKTDQPIIVFCRSGARSGQAASLLHAAGITSVVNGGGYMAVKKLVQK